MQTAPSFYPVVVEQHFPSPYRRPQSPLVMARRIPMGDGALIAAFMYAPDCGTTPDPAGPSAPTPVLMLHGNGEEHGIFGPIVDAAVAAGRCVIAVDSRAQGKSTRGASPLSYELLARDAVAVLDALGVPKVHVAGFSDGAIEALLIARDHARRVASLLAIGANLTPEGVVDDGWDLAGSVERNRAWGAYWVRRGGDEAPGAAGSEGGVATAASCGTTPDADIAPAVDPALLHCGPQRAFEQAELLQLMMDHPHIEASSLSAISVPTCIMAGEHDCIAESETRAMAAAIPGARLVIVPKMGHSLPKHAPADVSRELLINIILAG